MAAIKTCFASAKPTLLLAVEVAAGDEATAIAAED
jgi:hypothetical protein